PLPPHPPPRPRSRRTVLRSVRIRDGVREPSPARRPDVHQLPGRRRTYAARPIRGVLHGRSLPVVDRPGLRRRPARRALGGHPPPAPAGRPRDRHRRRRGRAVVRLVAPRPSRLAPRLTGCGVLTRAARFSPAQPLPAWVPSGKAGTG